VNPAKCEPETVLVGKLLTLDAVALGQAVVEADVTAHHL
jgi:hypothetical protein